MPRELYLLSPRPVALPDIVAAGMEVDGSLALRALYEGAAVQLVNPAGVAVVTIENSRLLEQTDDAARVIPGLALALSAAWYTEATAPWGADGAVGVAITRRLAELLGGDIRVEEGL